MIDDNIPKELENNKFIQELVKELSRITQENKLLKEQLNIRKENPEQVANFRGTITTHREIFQRNEKGKLCCNFCDGEIGERWRQRIHLEACDPNCASELERILFVSIDSYKKHLQKTHK